MPTIEPGVAKRVLEMFGKDSKVVPVRIINQNQPYAPKAYDYSAKLR